MSESVEDAYAGAIRRLLRQRDAIADELAAERARVERLQSWGLACEEHLYATDQYNPNRDYSDFAIGEFRRDYLHDGDLPDDNEGEVAT